MAETGLSQTYIGDRSAHLIAAGLCRIRGTPIASVPTTALQAILTVAHNRHVDAQVRLPRVVQDQIVDVLHHVLASHTVKHYRKRG